MRSHFSSARGDVLLTSEPHSAGAAGRDWQGLSQAEG